MFLQSPKQQRDEGERDLQDVWTWRKDESHYGKIGKRKTIHGLRKQSHGKRIDGD